jgi:hypothetical protein
MSELRRLLGPVQFNRLCDIAGGTRVHIPKHYGKPPNGGRDPTNRLKRLFGESLAILLVFHFGDSVLHVPKRQGNAPLDRKLLNRLVKRSDLSANAIARRARCDRLTVEKHRSRINAQRRTVT